MESEFDKEITGIGVSRRDFLNAGIRGAIGASAFLSAFPAACKRRSERIEEIAKRQLPFSGAIFGRDARLGHRFRDGLLEMEMSPPVNSKLFDVIIVGGGCSGLAAGWKLWRSDVRNFLVLEMESRTGGTSLSGNVGDLRFPWASHYLCTPPPEADYLHEMLLDIGVIEYFNEKGYPYFKRDYLIAEPATNIFIGGKWHRAGFPEELASSGERRICQAFWNDMYRWSVWTDDDGRLAFSTPIAYSSPSHQVRALDGITMREYLEERNWHIPILRAYVNYVCRDNFGVSIDEISAWAAIWEIQGHAPWHTNLISREALRLRPGEVITWPEGNDFLAQSLAQRFRNTHIRTNAFVTRIVERDGRIDVTLYDTKRQKFEALIARTVIFAAPKYLVSRIVPELKTNGRREYEQFEYTAWLVANIYLESLPSVPGIPVVWENIPYDSWSLGYVISDQRKIREPKRRREPTVITFYNAFTDDFVSERYELLEKGWEYWARRIYAELEEMHPGIGCRIQRLDLYKWGHAMVRNVPGFLWGKARQRMAQPLGRIFFANCDVGGIPIFEEATYAGIKAAQQAMKELGISYTPSVREEESAK